MPMAWTNTAARMRKWLASCAGATRTTPGRITARSPLPRKRTGSFAGGELSSDFDMCKDVIRVELGFMVGIVKAFEIRGYSMDASRANVVLFIMMKINVLVFG